MLALLVCSMLTCWAEAQRGASVSFFRGRVLLATGETPSDIVVQLLGINNETLHAALTDLKGSFAFYNVVLNDGEAFLVVEEEGFEPVRERLDGRDIRSQYTVFLRPEFDTSATTGDADSNGPVDLRQLVEPPEEAREEYDKALEESEKGDHSQAIEHLENALRLAPDFYEAQIKLGGEYLDLGQYRDAEAAYEQARQSNPNGVLVPLNLGILHFQEGELQAAADEGIEALRSFESARDALEEAIALDPISADAHFYFGATLYKMGGYAEAEERLQRVLELEAGFPQARLMLINVYARQNRYEAALEQAVAFLEENPDAPESSTIERVKSQIEAALGR